MKNEELDRLFRQKLEQLEGQPSPQAWQLLEQQLQHKKQRKIWFYISSIAASLLLLLGIWGSLEYSSSFIPSAPIAREQKPAQKKNSEQSPAVVTAPQSRPSQQPMQIAGNEAAAQEKQRPTPTTENKDEAPTQAHNTRSGTAKKISVQKAASLHTEPVELPQAEAKTALLSSLAEAGQAELAKPAAIIEPVIIRYKADDDELNNKTVELAERESKELTPRKVLGFLKKVKDNTSGSLAEFREAKDDLLSLRLSKADFNRAD